MADTQTELFNVEATYYYEFFGVDEKFHDEYVDKFGRIVNRRVKEGNKEFSVQEIMKEMLESCTTESQRMYACFLMGSDISQARMNKFFKSHNEDDSDDLLELFLLSKLASKLKK